MEEKEDGRTVVNWAVNDCWWWGAASAAQLGWGVSIWRRGYDGPSTSMPFKAFAVGSLFVGALACAGITSLRLSGIRSGKDMKTLGENIRTKVGLPSRESND